MGRDVSLIVTTGVEGSSAPEAKLNRALEKNTVDILEKSKSIAAIDRRFLITNSTRLLDFDTGDFPNLNREESAGEFHFGETLFKTIRNNDLGKVFYIGGGSGPLLNENDLEKIVEFISNNSKSSLANNFYSADMIGLGSTDELLNLEPPDKDNKLGWLARDAGLEPYEMTRSARTQLDLDSPVDLLSMKLSKRVGGCLADYLETVPWGNTRIREILPQFTDQESRLVIAGRIGAATWSHLEAEAACHVEVISEGRGSYTGSSRTSGRSSFLGNLFDDYGAKGLIYKLAEKGTGLFLDTRVLFNYLGEWPTRKDRFSSDLLNPEDVKTDYLRDLTQAALDSPSPVILGGHSMISGSLYLLSNVAWEITEPSSVNVKPVSYELNSNIDQP